MSPPEVIPLQGPRSQWAACSPPRSRLSRVSKSTSLRKRGWPSQFWKKRGENKESKPTFVGQPRNAGLAPRPDAQAKKGIDPNGGDPSEFGKIDASTASRASARERVSGLGGGKCTEREQAPASSGTGIGPRSRLGLARQKLLQSLSYARDMCLQEAAGVLDLARLAKRQQSVMLVLGALHGGGR